MSVAKATGMPIIAGLTNADDLPHTISFAINYREKINQLQGLPKDKRPPKNLWDKPFKLEKFLDEAFSIKGEGKKQDKFVEFDLEDVE